MNQMSLLLSLADDCRDQGEHDVEQAIRALADDVRELCAAIKSERAAVGGDSITYLEARLRTTQTLVKFDVGCLAGEGA